VIQRRRAAWIGCALGLVSSFAAVLVARQTSVETFDAAWRIVRDTHFDPTFNGVDWAKVRDELRPRAEAAATPDALRAVIGEMLSRLGLSHFVLMPGGAGDPASADLSGWPGFEFRLDGRDAVVVEVDAEGPAAGAITPGWSITAVDGRTVEEILLPLGRDQWTPFKRFEAWRLVTSRVRGSLGSQAEILLADETGKTRRTVIRRESEPGERMQVGNLPLLAVRTAGRQIKTPKGQTVGLIAFNIWMTPIDGFVQRAVDEYRGASGIVLDLRGNPGGLAAMIMGISGHFFDEPVLLGRMKTRDGELRLTANPRRVDANGAAVEPYSGPLAILVDGLTGSASECFAGGLQDVRRARVFGTPTMGQALPALFDRLPNGDVLMHAFGDFVTATGERLEGRGVVPDEEVPMSRAGLAAGRDAVLERALAWIDSADLRPRRGLW
jgi:carboxyl-terminal processing protease